MYDMHGMVVIMRMKCNCDVYAMTRSTGGASGVLKYLCFHCCTVHVSQGNYLFWMGFQNLAFSENLVPSPRSILRRVQKPGIGRCLTYIPTISRISCWRDVSYIDTDWMHVFLCTLWEAKSRLYIIRGQANDCEVQDQATTFRLPMPSCSSSSSSSST